MTDHSFHIPVMGIGFTIDTPIKVAHYGISSVVSLADDGLAERMREFYTKKLGRPFKEISDKIEDFRAKRITAFLNLMDEIVQQNFQNLTDSIHQKGGEFEKYMEMLPDLSEMKQRFNKFVDNQTYKDDMVNWFNEHITPGSIDVNIMTKLDKANYLKNELLPTEYNDAHAALRGFAQSNLESSVVLSAGMNPRLYSYFEQFDDFYPDENGYLKKKIILKVSDYRSAFIQGKIFAKKGLWISEYRIESGLNCGGHAFATDGFLLGPILEEFKNNKEALISTIHEMMVASLAEMDRSVPTEPLQLKITAQGGVGSAEEHDFLIDHYGLDAVGWGSPFLLVPEATNVDEHTQSLLSEAKEEDLYLSGISPLGVPFNSLKGNSKDLQKIEKIISGKPGSPCPKKYLVSNSDFSNKPICTASRTYQNKKLKELQSTITDAEDLARETEKVTVKSCICVGLGTSALKVNNLETKVEGEGVSVCPGPNMAYFSQTLSLKKMVDHIYGRANVINRTDRPNMFIKELNMYVDYLKNLAAEKTKPLEEKQKRYLTKFQSNLNEGISYYKNMFSKSMASFDGIKSKTLHELEYYEKELKKLV
jgi:hypothetical protein